MKISSIIRSPLSIFIVLLVGVNVTATQFKGYSRGPNTQPMTFVETVARINERDADFLILFAHHAAFYSLPKSKEDAPQVRDFLRARKKSQAPINVTIDPITGEILNIEDAQPTPAIAK